MKTVFLIVGHPIPAQTEIDPGFNAIDQVSVEAEKILLSDKELDCEVIRSSSLSTLHLDINRFRRPGDFAIFLCLAYGPSTSSGVSVLCADTPYRKRQGVMIAGAIAQSTKLISRGVGQRGPGIDRAADWMSRVDGLVASFIVELCYVTNKHESKLIAKSPELFARGLVEGIHAAAALT